MVKEHSSTTRIICIRNLAISEIFVDMIPFFDRTRRKKFPFLIIRFGILYKQCVNGLQIIITIDSHHWLLFIFGDI